MIEASSSGDRLPELGELLLFPETASLPVEWAVLGRDPNRPGLVLVVPADTHPKAGTADLEVPASSPVAPLTLRCGFEVWLNESRLSRATRTGDAVGPEEVAAARRIREARERGEPVGSLLAEEVDADPDYQDWIEEVLAPSRAALTAAAAAPSVVPLRRRAGHFGSPLAIAASVLLAASLGLLGRVVWQGRQIERLSEERERTEQELRQERERLTGELRRTEEKHRRALSEAEHRAEETRQLDRQRISDLERRLGDFGRPEALFNVPYKGLSPWEPVRGEAETLSVPKRVPLYLLVLSVNDLRPFPSYRLEIVDRDNKQGVWKGEGLKANSINEVSLALQRDDLPPGEYRLLLYGLKASKAELVAEYLLRLSLE